MTVPIIWALNTIPKLERDISRAANLHMASNGLNMAVPFDKYMLDAVIIPTTSALLVDNTP